MLPTRKLTSYSFQTSKLTKPVVFSVVSDLHNEPYDDLWPLVEGSDALLVPGDVSNRYTRDGDRGVAFLRKAARRLPTFFSVGNHETRQSGYRDLLKAIEDAGVEVLVNRFSRFGEMWIGGWYSPQIVRVPDMMDAFERLDGYKVLLCHKPHEYVRLLRDRDVDLVVSGHAHGGQIRIGNRGIYAPGQFLFPKYTHGVVDGRMVISAGAGNPVGLPRWNNPCEVVRIAVGVAKEPTQGKELS